jgi:hypothetical protein
VRRFTNLYNPEGIYASGFGLKDICWKFMPNDCNKRHKNNIQNSEYFNLLPETNFTSRIASG